MIDQYAGCRMQEGMRGATMRPLDPVVAACGPCVHQLPQRAVIDVRPHGTWPSCRKTPIPKGAVFVFLLSRVAGRAVLPVYALAAVCSEPKDLAGRPRMPRAPQ